MTGYIGEEKWNKLENEITSERYWDSAKTQLRFPSASWKTNYRVADASTEKLLIEIKGGNSSKIDKNQLNDYIEQARIQANM
jgi:hypothetical protein